MSETQTSESYFNASASQTVAIEKKTHKNGSFLSGGGEEGAGKSERGRSVRQGSERPRLGRECPGCRMPVGYSPEAVGHHTEKLIIVDTVGIKVKACSPRLYFCVLVEKKRGERGGGVGRGIRERKVQKRAEKRVSA